jgi:hypothetical protein
VWETKRKSKREKLKLTGGEHRLAQVLVKPEVFSIHMKGLKIQALGGRIPSKKGMVWK